jgi:hypothetical protein
MNRAVGASLPGGRDAFRAGGGAGKEDGRQKQHGVVRTKVELVGIAN